MNAKNQPHRRMAGLAFLAAAFVFASDVSAYVTTDQPDYAPGSTVTFLGDNSDEIGYLPGEIVIVDVNGPNGYYSWCEGEVDLYGAWSCQVTLPTENAAGDYAYTATGQASDVSESGTFKDAILTLYEDVALGVQRNAFAWGETVYAQATSLFANRCAHIEWFDPSNVVAETDDVVADGSGVITADFDVPATGPSGVWSARVQQGSTVGTCTGATFSTTGQQTQIFDIARVVIIGAGDPSTTTADSAGGDNFVSQATPGDVQASGGLGNTLSVASRSGLAKRTFLQFDIAGTGIPAGADVLDAKLRLWMSKSPTASGCVPRNYDLEAAAAPNVPWGEGSITWNNQPGVTGTASTVVINDTAPPPTSYVRFDVDDHVEDFLDGTLTNYGWRLKDRDESFVGVNCDTNFFSTESNQSPTVKTGFWPVLLIDYEDPTFPPLVTSGGHCTFDVNGTRDLDQFRLIFTPDQPNSTSTSPRWKLNGSNPGQLAFNVFVAGTPDTEETVTLTLPYPFVTQGANPVKVYDDFSIVENGSTCIVAGSQIAASASPATVGLSNYSGSTTDVEVTFTFPSTGIAYIAIHLSYGLKHVSSSCYPDNKTNVNMTCTLPTTKLIPQHAEYEFSFSDGQSGSATVENENVIKNDPGIAGLVTQLGSGDPVAGVTVEIWQGTKKLGTVYTDVDGWYQYTFKYTGKATTFTVKLPTYGLQQSVTLKSNGYVIVNFNNVP